MKRNFKLLVAVLVLAVMVFTLASCDMIGSVVDKFMPHEHEYSADWSSDETNHWHAALCDDAESADLAAHTFVEGVCSVCGYEKPVEDEKPACTHENMTPAETKAATCTEEGELTYTCSDCDYSFTEPTSKVDHTRENIKAVEPTCTETGLSKGEKCSVCDTILKAQTEIPATGHDFADGLCKSCYAMDPNYAEAVTYYLGVQGMDPFAAGAKKDKDTETFVNFFTIYYSEKMKLDTSSKTFDDGFSASQRLNWQGSTDISYTVYEKDDEGNDVLGEDGKPIVIDTYVKNAIEFVVPEGYTASVTVWWVCGGDGRQLVIYDAAENVVDETTVESAKNALYISTLEIGADGKYYLGNTGGSNYFFEVAVTLTPVGEKPSTPTLNGSGTYSEPYVLPTIGDYTTDAAGLVFYQYTVPADGFVTLSSNWDGGSVWLKLGTDINTADDNQGEGSSLKYFALKDTVVYIGVSDYNEVAEAIPFKVSFDEVTLGSIENVVGSWKGDFASMFGSATVIYSISEDGTGTASMNYGFGPNNSTIDKVVVVDNNVIIYLTNAYGSPETHNYVYAETEDGNKTLTGGVGSMTGELTPYDGEVGGNEPKPEVSYETVVVIGANTLYFSADEIAADAATRKLNVTVAGSYKFASGNLFVASVVDANGNTVAMNDDYSYTLAEGEYTLNFAMLSMFGVSADSACGLNVEDVNAEGGEGDEGGEEEYPEFQFDELKHAVRGWYDFEGYSVGIYESYVLGTYLANVYGEGFDLYFTFDVTANGDGSYALTLSHHYVDYETNPDMIETVLGYDIVVVPQPVEE